MGTGIGTVVGGRAAGAETGTVSGPVGTVVDGAIGALVGGLTGKGVAEAIDPTRERAYRSENFSVEKGSSFDDCGPAHRFGVNARGRYPGRDFDDVESEMSSDWAASRGVSILNWEWAKHAARDAWNRISPSSCLCA